MDSYAWNKTYTIYVLFHGDRIVPYFIRDYPHIETETKYTTIIGRNLGHPYNITSGKIIEYGCRDAPCKKSWKQGYPLSNTIKDTSTIMRNPLPELCREGLRMIVLVSLIVLLRGYPCFHDFLHGASLHPYSFN